MSSSSNSNLEKIEAKETTLFDRTFRDSKGKIVIAQMPNLPLIVGLAAFVLQYILPIGKLQAGADVSSIRRSIHLGMAGGFRGGQLFPSGVGLDCVSRYSCTKASPLLSMN